MVTIPAISHYHCLMPENFRVLRLSIEQFHLGWYLAEAYIIFTRLSCEVILPSLPAYAALKLCEEAILWPIVSLHQPRSRRRPRHRATIIAGWQFDNVCRWRWSLDAYSTSSWSEEASMFRPATSHGRKINQQIVADMMPLAFIICQKWPVFSMLNR